MSGVMPYRWLLPSQLAIIALQVGMIVQVASGGGPTRSLAIGLYIFATIYAMAMVVRFFVRRRPLIPIIFHWVLAAFLFAYASAYTKPAIAFAASGASWRMFVRPPVES